MKFSGATMGTVGLMSASKGARIPSARLIQRAADAGSSEGQHRLGLIYARGDAGQPRNDARAVELFTKAAEQGHAMAINMIGRCYDLGGGVEIDKARAAEWFKLAADRGLDWGLYNYATLLALGQGVAVRGGQVQTIDRP